MNQFTTLLKREFWENRGAMVTTPLVIGILMALGNIALMSVQWVYDNEDFTLRELMRQLDQLPHEQVSQLAYLAQLGPFSGLFTFVCAAAIFFYLLGSLYDDRKDRSILFWKSLPVSDFLTMASKLFTAMVLIPMAFWVFLVLTHIVLMLLLSIMLLVAGLNPWSDFLQYLQPLRAWGMLLASWLSMSVWSLPLYGWLMLVSAFSPRLPIIFAVLPPLLLAFFQVWFEFLRSFTLQENVLGVIGDWFFRAPIILGAEIEGRNAAGANIDLRLGVPLQEKFDDAVTVGNMLDRLASTDMLVGLALFAVFIGAAWWLRRRAADS